MTVVLLIVLLLTAGVLAVLRPDRTAVTSCRRVTAEPPRLRLIHGTRLYDQDATGEETGEGA